MASEPSNASDLPDKPDTVAGGDDTRTDGDAGPAQPAPAPILSEVPPPPDEGSEDDGRALLNELVVGTVVDGKYRVDQVIGRGAMGVVVAATHVHLGERAALKFLRYRAKAGAGDFQTRFKREARVSARLKNEHITRVVDVGVWRERVPYMVMDFLVGADLRQTMKASNGPMPVDTAINYAVQVCTGIAEAHAHGVVHRDLKPSNLFITKAPDGSDLVKILDFGISKWTAGEAELDELTQTGVVLGSPKYMSPEQLFGGGEVDSRADVWSLGAILYELLCGRPPFDFPTFTRICAELASERMPQPLNERRADVTPALAAVVARCFEREPAKRIQDVAELAGDLLDAVGAPFAGAVRAKIAATLVPPHARDPLSISGTGRTLGSGAFDAIGTAAGSSRPKIAPVDAQGPTGTPMPGSLTYPGAQSLESQPEAPPRRVAVVPFVIVAALLGSIAIYAAFSGHGVATPAAATPAVAPLPVAGDAPSASTPVTAPAASPAVSPPLASVGAPSASASAEPPARVTIAPVRGARAAPVAPPPVAANPPPPPVQPQTAAPPPPAPAPTPAATKRSDPLGDRQ